MKRNLISAWEAQKSYYGYIILYLFSFVKSFLKLVLIFYEG